MVFCVSPLATNRPQKLNQHSTDRLTINPERAVEGRPVSQKGAFIVALSLLASVTVEAPRGGLGMISRTAGGKAGSCTRGKVRPCDERCSLHASVPRCFGPSPVYRSDPARPTGPIQPSRYQPSDSYTNDRAGSDPPILILTWILVMRHRYYHGLCRLEPEWTVVLPCPASNPGRIYVALLYVALRCCRYCVLCVLLSCVCFVCKWAVLWVCNDELMRLACDEKSAAVGHAPPPPVAVQLSGGRVGGTEE